MFLKTSSKRIQPEGLTPYFQDLSCLPRLPWLTFCCSENSSTLPSSCFVLKKLSELRLWQYSNNHWNPSQKEASSYALFPPYSGHVTDKKGIDLRIFFKWKLREAPRTIGGKLYLPANSTQRTSSGQSQTTLFFFHFDKDDPLLEGRVTLQRGKRRSLVWSFTQRPDTSQSGAERR